MYCPNCGKEQSDSNKFCESCGASLESKTINLQKDDTQEINIPKNYYNNEEQQYYDDSNDNYHRRNNSNRPYMFAIVGCVFVIFLLVGGIITYFVVNNASKNAVQTAMNNTSSQSTNSSSASDSSKSSNDASDSNKASNQTTADENKTPPVPDEPPVIPSSMYGRNNYVMPYSDYSYVTSRQLSQLSNYELGIARNEIYARHGYIFQLDQFRRYFESQNWYVPRYTDQNDISLNKYEKYNAETIKAEEDSRGVRWN